MTAPASKTDRVLSALLRPLAKVEAAEAEAVDTFFVRLGDVLSAGVVWLAVRLALSTPVFELGAALP